MEKQKINLNGFSLLELLVILAIVAASVGLATTNMGSNIGRTSLNLYANTLYSMLDYAYNTAKFRQQVTKVCIADANNSSCCTTDCPTNPFNNRDLLLITKVGSTDTVLERLKADQNVYLINSLGGANDLKFHKNLETRKCCSACTDQEIRLNTSDSTTSYTKIDLCQNGTSCNPREHNIATCCSTYESCTNSNSCPTPHSSDDCN